MNCPKCQRVSKVLETRGPYRRRHCLGGHTFSTHEVQLSEHDRLTKAIKLLEELRGLIHA
jgi:hypothetical protein